jgi:LacI family transcriptional regulator
MEAVRRLSYIPNLLARSLLTQETAAIGVLIPDVSNPYYAAILRGIEDAVGPSGRTVILCNTDRDPGKQRLYLRALMERRVDGLIIAGGVFGRREIGITGEAFPLVMIGRHPARVPSVRVDNVAAAVMATTHLLDLGHRRIVCLAGPAISLTAADRLKGYRKALEAAAVAVDAGLIREVGFTPAAARDAVSALFGVPGAPTAVVASNDQVAIGAIRALHELGLRVPDDVSVVGFDDTPVASYTVPSLTTVAVPAGDLGRAAVALLVTILEGKRAGSIVLPCALRIRESTAGTHGGRD